MFKLLLKKLEKSPYFSKCLVFVASLFEKIFQRIKAIPEERMYHIQNIFVLSASYTIVSLLIYPKLTVVTFLKEIFSLLCAYGAIFFWFINKITKHSQFQVAIGVTACVAPVLFINNPFSIAVVCLILIVFCEFLIFEYIKGCYLFSDAVPVYVVCEDEQTAELALNFTDEYKMLELIVLSEQKNLKFSRLRSVDDIKEWLKKISCIPFFPTPKRFMYFSKKANPDNLAKLLELSAEFSIPLFKASQSVFSSNASRQNPLSVSPISFMDFETTAVSPQDKATLSTAFRNKRIWICYDGRGSVLDLICAISSVASTDVTVFCESELLAADAEQELNQCVNKNCKIKITDLNLLCTQDSKPDILFYNLPIKSVHSGEDNLKETVIKNILDTNKLIQFAQSVKIPFVFVLSGTGAINASNWVGATQRFGELLAQFADSQSRKQFTKFRVIRVPDAATDRSGIFGKIISSVFENGYVNIDFPNSELATVYYRKDILPPLLKTVTSTMKSYDNTSSVFTIAPKNGIVLEELIKYICNIFCLRKDKDIQVTYSNKSETMELDNFPNISESLEKTTIANVLCTKFPSTNSANYANLWTIEEINGMTTRELIAAVFQSLSEKIKK